MKTRSCRKTAGAVSLFILVLVPPLYADQGSPPSKPDPKLVDGNTQFALDLYAQLRSGDDNMFFSPLSLSTALAMTYGGARGDTAKEMKQALHFDLESAQLHPAMAGLLGGLEAPKEKAPYQLNIANALWVEQSYGLLPDFVKLCQDNYQAVARPVDFKTAAEAQRKIINDWVEERTSGKIKDLLPAGTVAADTRLVLTNAIYFKGNWKEQFDRARTREAPFTLTNGKTVVAPMMGQKCHVGYMEQPDLQVVEMPYNGDALSMVILLPRKVDGLADLERTLNAQALGGWIGKLRAQELYVGLPRFTMTASYQLNPKLQALGMRDAFSQTAADFSGMSGKRDLFISAVVHKAFVDVNEEGTEAAAATGVGAAARSMPPSFRADHPFIFLIRDTRSGGILFLGRVMNPKASPS
ncbi:MAG TPA: serpin family protein [Phycisphaerae bacterium]|nr:serpin family protein [Phycisphaerae bacterium]